MTRLRLGLILAAVVVAIVVLSALVGSGGGVKTTATTTPAASVSGAPTEAAAPPSPGHTPIVAPPPAIPLPQCPPSVVPEVDNPARYGFCVPPGWGAYNENNSQALTQLLKPHLNDPNPVILPTDFARIQIVIALNTPPTDLPADCTGAPNDTIAGLPAHHCTAPLDASKNPYHADEAQFWRIELPQGKSFYITAQSGSATQDDLTTISGIVHLVRPLGNR